MGAVQVGVDNFVFFSAPSYDEHLKPHRIGWARATKSNGTDGAWNQYADSSWFDSFSKTRGGEIDPSVYEEVDASGTPQYYLLWKSDDNAAGESTTRLWMHNIVFQGGVAE